MNISHTLKGKNNNFGLVRLLAAVLVILSHSFDLLAQSEPLAVFSGHMLSFGSLAVNSFFVLSGFLITASFINGDVKSFVLNRVLRIYPALTAAVLFSIVVAAFYQSAGVFSFIFSVESLAYLKQNSLLIVKGVSHTLPGVYGDNHIAGSVNGSLWTLQFELCLYVSVFVMGVMGCLKDKQLYVLVCVGIFLVYAIVGQDKFFLSRGVAHAEWPIFCFFLGSMFYVFRDVIALTFTAWITLLALFIANKNGALAEPTFFLLLSYSILFFSLHPRSYLPKLDFKNDYSYGMYLYAFPIQQAVIASGMNKPFWVFAVSVFLTCITAYFSWHYLEKRALKLKNNHLLLR